MVFEYSYWWILPAMGTALLVAYYKFRKLSLLPDIARGIVLLTAALRGLVVFTLFFLLLRPALSVFQHIQEKPLLVIAQDNSVSIVNHKDSLYYLQEYRASLEKAVADLKDKFEVAELTFGNTVKKGGEVDFSENRTNIAALLEYVRQNFMFRQPEGMILLSDGIYNTGANPLYKLPAFPVYTVMLGDTLRLPDVYVRKLEANKFNFLHTLFPVKAEIGALKQKGRKIKCLLLENGNVIKQQNIDIDRDNFLTEVTFEVAAQRKGIMQYSIRLETGFAERTLENNQAETRVSILDHSGDIRFYASAPHPDIAAIRNAIQLSGIYKCSVHRFDEPLDSLKANLIILHNPEPGNPGYQHLLREANRRKISLWYILTGRENMIRLARFVPQYTVDFNTGLEEYATVAVNREFPYFEFTNEEVAGFSAFPPLTVPFGEIRTGAGRALLTQKVKNTPTSNGMLAFYDLNGSRIGYFWGEGLWRWRLYDYLENGNHELFNTLVGKIVGYLATRTGNERFIYDIKPLYDETEETDIRVELYNKSYELVNTPEVKLELTAGEKQFHYVFNRQGDKYRLNLGNLPAGEYAYQLSANLKGEHFIKKGNFYVRSHNPEWNDAVANSALLQAIADHTKAQMYGKQHLSQLVEQLHQKEEWKPVYKSEVKYINLSEMGMLGLILLLLLCIEWFLLKFFAG